MPPPGDFLLYIYELDRAMNICARRRTSQRRGRVTLRALWVIAIGPSVKRTRSSHLGAWVARDGTPNTVLDVDYRQMLWSPTTDADKAMGEALNLVIVAVGNAKECEVAAGERDPHRVADALLARGLNHAIVNRSPRRRARKDCGGWADRDRPANGLGADHSFGSGLCPVS
jgi:5-dehydro-2-deoxygluconokinase